ncbi:HigA family addiction module antitoxin [Candidatus Symbiobacter mobilis]|uniref:Plasmid maintenance system antidote protein n=1 Tax=Candidatus Symbiobacter mobilis CR TaxID=946483 RepID=U5NER3_9BURK|nr:HigA family addiction module antitoxin [Candidatus Symbiobacter mobilis]AGX88654.1 plasmid maintenance system antidote protein [Candidatus Symbiobacter mobilis CR]
MKNLDNGLPAIHPGEFLHEILVALRLTQTTFAEAIGVSPMRVSHLLRGQRPVTAELALRLGRALGQTPQYWLNLQSAYDLKIAQVALKDSLKDVRVLEAA